MKQRNVLVIFPHPDDETLAVGGVIALHAHQGAHVTYACFTLGQMGRNMGKPFFANRETLPEIREKELREACNLLGIDDLRLMGFRDKTLEFEDPETLIKLIYDMVLELQPSVVITYYPGYCVHPDHEALATATIQAIARLPEGSRPQVQCQAFANNHREELGEPDIVLDTSGVWERQYGAMKAHKSQTAAWIERIEKQLNGDAATREEFIRNFSLQTLYTYPV